MEIRFYQVSVSKNSVKKVFDNSPSIILEGELRSNTSFLKPVIEIAMSDTMYANLTQYNYVYIEIFARYYFIEDMIYTSTKMTEVYLSVDVLSSHWDKIKNETAYIERSNQGSSYLEDNRLPFKEGTAVKIIEGTNNQESDYIDDRIHKFYFFKEADNITNDTTYNVIVSCTTDKFITTNARGVSHSSNMNTLYLFTLRQLKILTEQIISQTSLRNNGLGDFYTNFSEAIIDIRIYPFALRGITENGSIFTNVPASIAISPIPTGQPDAGKTQLRLGVSSANIDNFGTYYTIVGNGISTLSFGEVFLGATIQQSIYDNFPFLYFSDKTICQLFIPYYGFKEINLNNYLVKARNTGITYGANIYVKGFLDVANGNLTLNLYKKDTLPTVLTFVESVSFDVSLQLPVGRSNAYDQYRAQQIAGLKVVLNTISAGASYLLGSFGNASMMTKGNISVPQAAINSNALTQSFSGSLLTNAVSGLTEMLEHTKVSVNTPPVDNGTLGKGYLFPEILIPNEDCLLKLFFYLPVPNLDDTEIDQYRNDNEYPTKTFKVLNELSGYAKIGYMRLNTDDMYRDENDELYLILQSGIFINTNT